MKRLGIVLIFCIILILNGCSQSTNTGSTGADTADATTSTSDNTTTTTQNPSSAQDSTIGTSQTSTDLSGIVYVSQNEVETSYLELKEEDLDDSQDGGEIVDLSKGSIEITKAGTYHLSGTLANGQVTVNVKDDDQVRLILDQVTITNTSGPAIYVINADKVIITLVEGTTNTVTDSDNYILTDVDGGEPDAVIFSHDDLTINGTGTLVVNGNYNDGIKSKDKLVLVSGTYDVNAVGDGIVGKDRLVIHDGAFDLNVQNHGLKATNSDEENKGVLAIVGGTFTITSGEDALHSSRFVYVLGGTFEINAGDDGVHSDYDLTIFGGTLNINSSYEGIEGSTITVESGTVNIVASDDGVNVAGGNDQSGESFPMPGAQGNSTFSTDHVLTINGGTIHVNALGDGLDANGLVLFNGGTVYVSGPTENFNGALDYDSGFIITNGVLVAAGSAGMAQAPSETSTQNSIHMTFTSVQSPGTEVILKDAKGNTIVTYAPEKEFQTIVLSSPDLLKDGNYTLSTSGSISVDFTIDSSVTWLNESGVTTAQTQMGGFGGGFPDKNGGQRGDHGTPPTDGTMPNMPTDGTRPDMPSDGTRPDFPTDGTMPTPPNGDGTTTQPNN